MHFRLKFVIAPQIPSDRNLQAGLVECFLVGLKLVSDKRQ